MADYKTRLTADTSQHDAALKKSAQQVYQYKKKTDDAKVTLGNLAKKFGPLAAQIGIAGGALGVFNKAIRSTEQGSDAMDRALHVAKSSVDRFFQSISSGSFNAFTDGLDEITKAAREAYNALDDLGTMKMWNNADIAKQQTIISRNRTIIYDPKATEAQKKAAQKAIEDAIKEIERLNGELVSQSKKASEALLREYAGTTRVTTATLERYREMLKKGTLGQYAADYREKNSYQSPYTVVPTEGMPYTMYETKWKSDNAKLLYSVMQSFLTLPENKWQALLDIETQNEQRMQQLEQMKMMAERTESRIGKGNGTTTPPKVKIEPEIEPIPEGSIKELETAMAELKKKFSLATTDEERAAIKEQIKTLQDELDRMNGVEIKPEIKEGSIAYIQQQIRELTTELENTPDATVRIKLQANIADLQQQLKEMQTTDAERAAEKLKQKYAELQTQLNATASTFSSLGSIFNSLGDCFEDEGQKVMQVIGTVMNGIATLIPQIAALTASEEAEAMASGTASAAKLPYPANLAAIASVIATIMGVIGSIASIASSGKYANGGIIQGNTTIGDYNLARVNAGEMILNNRQQQHLFNLLNGNTQVNTITDGGNVTFTIHGSDLQGTLNNYNKRINRVR